MTSKLLLLIFIISLMGIITSCEPQDSSSEVEQQVSSLDMADVFAWCIVPFDSVERSPQERMTMLEGLGIQQYAYDWRTKHLDEMAEEINLAKEHDIAINAVWIWIDANADQPEKLSVDNERMLTILEESGLKTDIWVGFHQNYYEGLSDEEAVSKGQTIIDSLYRRAEAIGCRLALYNHGDWFGDPINQVKIINKLSYPNLGIVYSFHHAHDQIDRLDEIIQEVMPHLWYVNLNGMQKDGPKILPIGKGTHEADMLQKFLNAGYNGPLGILGHVEEADVEIILQQNLEGLQRIIQDNQNL